MSLTLQPVSASFFIKADPGSSSASRFIKPDPRRMEAARHSLEGINLLPKEQFTGKWVQGYSRLLDSSTSPLGTTFPPRGGLMAQRLRRPDLPRSSNSEPNLAYNSDSEDDEDQHSGEDRHDDDDHLFEFDLCDEDEETVVDVRTPEPLEPLDVLGPRTRTLSLTSNSSAGSCTHRKPKLEAVESPSPKATAPGFKSIFTSSNASSGFGSEHRLSQEPVEDEEAGGQTFEPSEWRDYMQDRISEGSSTPITGRATPLTDPSPSPVTPILTASPATTLDSPLISPDSLLDGQLIEENRETFQSTGNVESCPQCNQSDSALTLSTLSDQQEDSNRNVLVLSSGLSKTEIREEDLKLLLGNLDDDRGYPGVKNHNDSFTDDSMEDESKVFEDLAALEESRDKESTGRIVARSSSTASVRSEVSEISPLREFEEEKPRLRKCSSLKTSRSPPRTTGEKKYVRFADIFGLDLSEVKTFTDEIPRIPKAAFQDLDVDMSDFDVGSPRPATPPIFKFKAQSTIQGPPRVTTTSLVPMFTQPGCSPAFLSTVREHKVCLENAFTQNPTTISGIVRVLNIDFHKAVTVRWTVNDWRTHCDQAGTYVDGSSDGFTDKFSFKLAVGSLPVGSRIQFCLKLATAGTEFWDSNNGANYVFQVFLSSNSPGGGGGTAYRSSPAQAIQSASRFVSTYQASPSLHGDDPWLRFM